MEREATGCPRRLGKVLAAILGVPLGIAIGLVAAAAILLGFLWLPLHTGAGKGAFVRHNEELLSSVRSSSIRES